MSPWREPGAQTAVCTKERALPLTEPRDLDGHHTERRAASSREPATVRPLGLSSLDDAALAARASDDPDAFRTLFHRHVNDIHAFVRRRTFDDALTDDIVATTFERCWDALPTLDLQRSTLRPWLMRVAANLLADHHRSSSRRRRREQTVHRQTEPLGAATPNDPAETAAGGDTELIAAIGQLNERHQTVLSLRFLADLSTEEAAAAMNVDRRHFAVLQHRALQALRRHLEVT